MWRLNACERLIEPDPRALKRLAAPLFVFIFGMMFPKLPYRSRWWNHSTL
jgi:hypothetical protein